MKMENMRVALKTKEVLEKVSELYAKGERNAALDLVGETGEQLTERFFQQTGIGYEKIPQKLIKKLPKTMLSFGAKRPDYHLDIGDPFVNDEMVVADAKHYRPTKQGYFTISEEEIKKYRGLVEYLKDEYEVNTIYVLFAVWVQGTTDKVYFYQLDQFGDDMLISPTTICDPETGKNNSAVMIKLEDAHQEKVSWQKS
ncbi:hypothetical protein J0692_04795 [Vibrio alginolyticus]|uniref:hypothetical protein n=1 Tax=Vibrio alginolyticus TaxID=663 RepID=UPI001A902390|nr:hypothetical protein [Vibrio alginolyticus]MBO0161545.1 hypothetical protein [Vibrio alginolyticus]